jgi:carbonic anhydrase
LSIDECFEMTYRKIFSWATIPLLLAAALPAMLYAAGPPHWSYSGDDGPEHWGDLAPEFVQCKVGVNQSPVDIVGSVDADLPPLRLHYTGNTIDVVNNGHTAQVNAEPGNTLEVDGDVFELKQFHMHAPSEHHIEGKSFLMEAHLVHANSRGQLAVIGILYTAGPTHPDLAGLEGSIPETINRPVPLRLPLTALALPKEVSDYYRYNGSLTTPPCSEGVRWFVLPKTRTLEPQMQQKFIKLIGEDARGPQPINSRLIVR